MTDEIRDESNDDSAQTEEPQQPEVKPSEDVQSPPYQSLTEGYTPPKKKDKSEDLEIPE